ncbi:MAG: ATP-binding protein [Pyrinomonadaceae bacterium]
MSETASLIAALFENQPQLINVQNFERFVTNGKLAALEVVSAGGDVLLSQTASDDANNATTQATRNAVLQIARGEIVNGTKRDAKCDAQFCFAIVPLKNENTDDTRRLIVVRADPHLSRIAAGAELFQYLRNRQLRLRNKGLLTISLLTLLSLFASMWIALHLARGIATPIAALTEAAHEVAEGNLSHRVTTIANDELAFLAASFNDMTAQLEENRRKIEAGANELREKNLALAERRDYIETVLESLSSGVISLDARDCVTTINVAALQMLRLQKTMQDDPTVNVDISPSSIVGKPLFEIIGAEDYAVFAPIVRRARRMGQASQQAELTRRNNENDNGEIVLTVPIALTASALNPHVSRIHLSGEGIAGDACGVVLVIEDLTELLTAQRAAAWSEVARRMAHEIKNPLTPIQLSAERIARNFARLENGQASNGSETKEHDTVARIIEECTTTITREVASLKAMVDEFASFARLPVPKFEQADVNDVMRHALALYEERLGGVRLAVKLAVELPPALIDAEQVRRVIVNLMDNALEAIENDVVPTANMTAHGVINHSGNGVSTVEPRITVATGHDPARSRLLIEITDTGHGISPQDYPRLFQPYFSTRGRGTGLGLAIVRRIITEHGGRIRAEANHPRGAKFIVELPTG